MKTPLVLLPALLLILLAGLLVVVSDAFDLSLVLGHQEDMFRFRQTHPLALATAGLLPLLSKKLFEWRLAPAPVRSFR